MLTVHLFTGFCTLASLAVGISQVPGAAGGRTYRYYPMENALWPFGYGLSYTSFNLSWAPGTAPAPTVNLTATSSPLPLTIRVANTGGMDGDTVLQLYYTPVNTTFGALEPEFLPAAQLFGFVRVRIAHGQSSDVQLAVDPAELLVTGSDNVKRPLPGKYTVSVTDGGAMAALSSELSFSVTLA